MKMKILVTGAAGFIGSNLCDYLLKQGNVVVGVDNFITGTRKHIEALAEKYGASFKFIFGDAAEYQDDIVDQIYHLASPASPKFYQQYAMATMMAGSNAAINLMEHAKLDRARILVASTSEIYGSAMRWPQSESYWGNTNCFGPRAMYDEAKRFQEAVAWVYINKFKVDARIARIFNTYGPNMRDDDGRVIPQFITQALNNEPITIHGDGRQTRSFCYVDDLVRGLVALMDSDCKYPVNLGNPHEITVRELAELIIRFTRSESKIILTDRPADDPERRCPDISLAKHKLDWCPYYELGEGLRLTIDYFKQLQPTT